MDLNLNLYRLVSFFKRQRLLLCGRMTPFCLNTEVCLTTPQLLARLASFSLFTFGEPYFSHDVVFIESDVYI